MPGLVETDGAGSVISMRERMAVHRENPTCASCHMSGNIRNGGRITHDPGERISWTNRPPISARMDTDKDHKVIKEKDPAKRTAMTADSWEDKRTRMREVCTHCHSSTYVTAFYGQYDDFVNLYNEKFGKPGTAGCKNQHQHENEKPGKEGSRLFFKHSKQHL